jgi:hypothetical protein
MPNNTKQLSALLSIIALLTALTPVGAMEWACDRPMEDACCAGESGGAPTERTNEGDPSPDDDCCPSGCDDCFLQCCNGIVSHHPFSVALGTDQSSSRTTPEDDEEVSSAHARAVDHPPQP